MVYLPITVIVALLGSLFVGMIVNPALAGNLMYTREAARHEGKIKRLDRVALVLECSWSSE